MTSTRRKLTTILSADVQDYTRLMGLDEEGTLENLKRCRAAMSGLISLHGGRVINTWGDGLIADFPSVVEAVRAAVDIQNELAGQNATRPEGSRMQFRIGINLGDVIEQDDDIYGDGVNIAARLQTSAQPGGIVISSTVYDHVRNKVAVGFDFLGALEVKNVSEAVPSYSVRVGDAGPAVREHAPTYTPPPQPAPSRAAPLLKKSARNRLFGSLGSCAAIVFVINILTWKGEFWAAWPLLAFATAAGLLWARGQPGNVRRLAMPAIMAVALIAINALSWSGVFWAQWPLLAIAAGVALRWRRRA